MLKQFFYSSLIMLVFAVSSGVAQESTIYTRLQTSMPVFNASSCSVFMLPYGASEKEIRKAATLLDLQYLAKEPLERIPGAYLLIYGDPDNITAPDGDDITSSIVYIFTIHPKTGYFSYSTRMQFTTDRYLQEALQSLRYNVAKNIEMQNFTTVNVAITRCGDESTSQFDGVRMFSCIEDDAEPVFLFTVLDMSVSETLQVQQPPSMNNRRK